MKKEIVLAAFLFVIAAFRPLGGYQVGDVVADFKLKNVDGKMISLAMYKNTKGFIIIFDSNTCPYSKAYFSRIFALNKKYSDKGFPAILINSNDTEASPGDSFDEMIKEAKSNEYVFPYLKDDTQDVVKQFGATATPHVFVLTKKERELKVAYMGAIDDSARDISLITKKYVEDAVDALLAGKEVPISKTKAIGCRIPLRGE